MLDILEAHSADLGPTLTYAKRSMCWIPLKPGVPHNSSEDGRLLVNQQVARGYGCKVDSDTYGLEEQPQPIGRMGRVFLLVNLSDKTQEQPYEVYIGQPLNQCTCKAGKCKLEECKHRAACAYLVANDLIHGAAS